MFNIFYFGRKNDFTGALESLFASYQSVLTVLEKEEELLQMAERSKPDLVLINADEMEKNDFSTGRTLKQRRLTRNIPILYLASEKTELDARDVCLKAGGDDCLLKPINIKELVAHSHRLIKKAGMLDKMRNVQKDGTEIRSRFLSEIEKLNQINRSLEETALIDKMTGIYNRDQFEIRVREEFHRAHRYATPLSLALIDIDSFGRINDNFGHEVGDYILLRIANVLQLHSRHADTVCRLDGAAFAVILPRTDMQHGVFESERLRVAINQTEYIDKSALEKNDVLKRSQRIGTEITASFGVGTYPFEKLLKNETDLVDWARKALDRAKISGKNKTVSAAELL